MEQSRVENLLRMKARARVPVLKAALAKVTAKISGKAAFVANAKARAEKKVAAWENLKAQYDADLATIEGGSYPGYNGKPFGATPTITEGLV